MIARATFPALGGEATVATEASLLERARELVASEVRAVDAACSRFRSDSELTALNEAAGRPFRASPLFAEAIEVALRAARQTGGAVDPTVGGAMLRIGYDADFESLPSRRPGTALQALAVPGWRLVRIDRTSGVVVLPPGVRLDLGATAKALAADRAAAAAHRTTGGGVLVSLSGDLAVAGPCPDEGWTVLIADDHRGDPEAPGPRVVVRSGGLATSSTAVRRWRVGDSERHHLVDPATGLPVTGPWRTVSVAAASCVEANTAATAAVVLGEAAEGWLASRNLPARLVGEDGRTVVTGGWPADAAS